EGLSPSVVAANRRVLQRRATLVQPGVAPRRLLPEPGGITLVQRSVLEPQQMSALQTPRGRPASEDARLVGHRIVGQTSSSSCGTPTFLARRDQQASTVATRRR